MTFEEWDAEYDVCANCLDQWDGAKTAWEYQQARIDELEEKERINANYLAAARNAGRHQQARIDELEHKLALRDAFIAGIQFGKAQESE